MVSWQLKCSVSIGLEDSKHLIKPLHNADNDRLECCARLTCALLSCEHMPSLTLTNNCRIRGALDIQLLDATEQGGPSTCPDLSGPAHCSNF